VCPRRKHFDIGKKHKQIPRLRVTRSSIGTEKEINVAVGKSNQQAKTAGIAPNNSPGQSRLSVHFIYKSEKVKVTGKANERYEISQVKLLGCCFIAVRYCRIGC
jgi:hypothetical protein